MGETTGVEIGLSKYLSSACKASNNMAMNALIEPQLRIRMLSQRRSHGFGFFSSFNTSHRTNCFMPAARCLTTLSSSLLGVSDGASQTTSAVIRHCVVPLVLPTAAAVATAAYIGAVPLDPSLAPWLRPMLVGSGPIMLHVVIPLLDILIGERPALPLPAAARAPPTDEFAARMLPVLAILIHLAVAAAAYAAVAAAVPQPSYLLPLLLYSIGTSAAITMAASHELVHSRNPVHLAVAATCLSLHWWYPYYRSHHQHHLHVGTPVDYTCAPRGQTIYSYLPRYIVGGYVEAWQLSCQACDRAGKPRFSHHNSTLVALVAQALLTAAIYAIFGPLVTAIHLGASAVLLSYMAIFDYVLHYGLVRPPLPGSEARRYTPITPFTSWNSTYPIENALLFNVLLHSDHHMYGNKSYGWLRPPPSAPTFPGPVNLVALSVLLPPLWRALMDPRADEANAKHMSYLGYGADAPVPAAVVAGP